MFIELIALRKTNLSIFFFLPSQSALSTLNRIFCDHGFNCKILAQWHLFGSLVQKLEYPSSSQTGWRCLRFAFEAQAQPFMVSFMGIMKKLITEEAKKVEGKVVTVRANTELIETDRHRETIEKWNFCLTRDFERLFRMEVEENLYPIVAEKQP